MVKELCDPGTAHSSLAPLYVAQLSETYRKLRGTGKLYIALGRPLYLTVSTELYVYRDLDNPPGAALDLNVGLKVLLSGHRQQF